MTEQTLSVSVEQEGTDTITVSVQMAGMTPAEAAERLHDLGWLISSRKAHLVFFPGGEEEVVVTGFNQGGSNSESIQPETQSGGIKQNQFDPLESV